MTNDQKLQRQLEALEAARKRLIEHGGQSSLIIAIVENPVRNGNVEEEKHIVLREGTHRGFVTAVAAIHNRFVSDGLDLNGFKPELVGEIIRATGNSVNAPPLVPPHINRH